MHLQSIENSYPQFFWEKREFNKYIEKKYSDINEGELKTENN